MSPHHADRSDRTFILVALLLLALVVWRLDHMARAARDCMVRGGEPLYTQAGVVCLAPEVVR